MQIELPKILDIPEKLLPMITEFNSYRYLLAEGGRGSGKSHAVARFILYLGSIKKLRIICAREIQNSIEESVYQLLVDIIREFSLDYDIKKNQITHRETGSTIRFKGCREQGAVSLKSMEGVDLIWLEEAQSVTQTTLDIIMPTIRKEKAKFFFTMNRYVRNDPVFATLANRDDCLHIHIDYFENKFCPEALKYEAEQCKVNNPKEYAHIWLGQPLATTSDYLFNFDKLAKMPELYSLDEPHRRQRALSIDFAGGGGDLCVATLLERVGTRHWEVADQEVWSDPDTDSSVGKSIGLYGKYQPDVFVVDAGGLGYPMFISISKTVPSVIGFDGAKTDKVSNMSANNRAEGYLTLKEWTDKEWLICKSKLLIQELETIKTKHKANGNIFIQSKIEMRKEGISSPDRADSLMMGIWAIKHYLGKQTLSDRPIGMRLERVNVVNRGKNSGIKRVNRVKR